MLCGLKIFSTTEDNNCVGTNINIIDRPRNITKIISMSSNYGRLNNNGSNDIMMFTVQTIILKVR